MNDNYSSLSQGYRGLFDVKMSELFGGSGTVQSQCMNYVVERFLEELHNYTENTFLYSCIENLPDKLLDYLATEWDLPYYEQTLDKDKKIKLVMEGFEWRKTAGTTGEVERLIEKVFTVGEVSEWYEYGGEPGYFKITAAAPFISSMDDFIKVFLKKEKNARSWLEAIRFVTPITLEISPSAKVYYFSPPLCGTIPKTSRGVGMAGNSILLSHASKGVKISWLMSGEGNTGEYPNTNMSARVAPGDIVLTPSKKGMRVTYVLPNDDMKAGTYPKTSTGSETEDNSLTTKVTAANLRVTYPMCGNAFEI